MCPDIIKTVLCREMEVVDKKNLGVTRRGDGVLENICTRVPWENICSRIMKLLSRICRIILNNAVHNFISKCCEMICEAGVIVVFFFCRNVLTLFFLKFNRLFKIETVADSKLTHYQTTKF